MWLTDWVGVTVSSWNAPPSFWYFWQVMWYSKTKVEKLCPFISIRCASNNWSNFLPFLEINSVHICCYSFIKNNNFPSLNVGLKTELTSYLIPNCLWFSVFLHVHVSRYIINIQIMATPAPRIVAVAPDKGSFPLDHEGRSFLRLLSLEYIFLNGGGVDMNLRIEVNYPSPFLLEIRDRLKTQSTWQSHLLSFPTSVTTPGLEEMVKSIILLQ